MGLSPDSQEIQDFFKRYDEMVLNGKSPKAVLATMFADLKTFIAVTDSPDQTMNLLAAYYRKTYTLATRAFPSVDPRWANIKPVEEMNDEPG